MAGRKQLGPISEPEYAHLLQALSTTTKGRSFLNEYRRRFQPAETLDLIKSMSLIESTLTEVHDQLRPERIADELRHISMTLDIALEGAPIDPEGDETQRRFALADQARHELAVLAQTLLGEMAPAPKEAGQAGAPPAEPSEAR